MKRVPISPTSKRRQRENADRAKAMESAFGPRNEWRCKVSDDTRLSSEMGTCFGPIHGHEIVKRSQGGSIVDTRNIVLLCNRHNDWCEEFRGLAHELGLVRSAWEAWK